MRVVEADDVELLLARALLDADELALVGSDENDKRFEDEPLEVER